MHADWGFETSTKSCTVGNRTVLYGPECRPGNCYSTSFSANLLLNPTTSGTPLPSYTQSEVCTADRPRFFHASSPTQVRQPKIDRSFSPCPGYSTKNSPVRGMTRNHAATPHHALVAKREKVPTPQQRIRLKSSRPPSGLVSPPRLAVSQEVTR